MKTLLSYLFKFSLVALVLVAVLAVYLDAKIRYTFEEKQWSLPAQVYARPLELYAGQSISAEDLVYELKLLGYKQTGHVTRAGQWRWRSNGIELYTRGFDFSDEAEPARHIKLVFSEDRLAQLSNGHERIEIMRLEPVKIGGIYPRHGEDRLLVRLDDDVPDKLAAGLVAVEDKGFYDHFGLSLVGIARAAAVNMKAGARVQGGSTLTQQLIKNYYLSSEKTLVRKGLEAVMAVLLELHASKEQILEGYINEVYLGQDGPRAIHGFALASQHYFGVPLESIGLHQQALLIGMVKGPSLYNPLRNPQQATKRRNIVLDVMQREGIISPEQALVTKAMPLGIHQLQTPVNSYPAFLDLVRRQLRRDYRQEDLSTLGLKIFTTFDPLLQRDAENSVKTVLNQLDGSNELETAMVVSGLDNGEVKAIVGGRKPRYAGFNRALDAVRPTGSLLKPAVYLTALERSQDYTLATVISDAPVTIADASGIWEPQNFDLQSHDWVTLHQSLTFSYNQAAARLGVDLGINNIIDTLQRLGIERPLPEVPSLTLGAGGLSPVDVASMYQTIAAGGFRLPLRTIRHVVDARGNLLKSYPLQYDRAVAVEAMHLLHYALQEVVREGTGRGVYQYLPENFNVAGKTGTTDGLRDSWFAGFSGDLVTTTWIGRDDNGDTGLTGSTGALKLWAHFMRRASDRSLAYRIPESIEHHWVDGSNGLLSGEHCENSRLLPFIAGSEPSKKAFVSGAQGL